jgi:hypothetical protein
MFLQPSPLPNLAEVLCNMPNHGLQSQQSFPIKAAER